MFSRAGDDTLTIRFAGQAVPARPGDSVATALLAAGLVAFGTHPVSGTQRGPFCMMGACYGCMTVIDGQPNQRACMTPVRDGMVVALQEGAPAFGAIPESAPSSP